VTVTPLHHHDPRRRAVGHTRPALGRPRRFRPPAAAMTAASMRHSMSTSATQPGHLRRRHGGDPEALGPPRDRISHHGKHYQFDDVRITPKPIQKSDGRPISARSPKPSESELAARLGYGLIVAPLSAASMSYGRPQAGRRPLQRDLHQARQEARPPDVAATFAHFYDTPAQEKAQRERQIRLLQGMRDPGAAGRRRHPAPPELPLFRRTCGGAACTRWSRRCSPTIRCCSATTQAFTRPR